MTATDLIMSISYQDQFEEHYQGVLWDKNTYLLLSESHKAGPVCGGAHLYY